MVRVLNLPAKTFILGAPDATWVTSSEGAEGGKFVVICSNIKRFGKGSQIPCFMAIKIGNEIQQTEQR